MSARALAAVAVALLGCRRDAPPQDRPEGALWRLRAALASDAPLDSTLVDTELLAQARLLARMRRIHEMQEGHPQQISDDGWRALLDDLSREESPARARRRLAPMLPRLGDGRCVRVSARALPPELSPLAPLVDAWPASAHALHARVAGRVSGLTAAVYRCAGGDVVAAITAPGAPPDGRLRVVDLTAP